MSYLNKPDKYTIYFAPDNDKIVRQDGNIETILKTTISPNEPVELRKIKLTNTGLTEEIIEITSMLEPMLSKREQDYAHKVFNNLFLTIFSFTLHLSKFFPGFHHQDFLLRGTYQLPALDFSRLFQSEYIPLNL